ncbi:DegT/DnrJ/EryC1/StrS family aminotransferase [Rubritalea tangerina]|uniref:DegT/DnrJ/EryC1/StrS family aminotransferase n=1 Tax=Rubritalea tangerina TaxID=430798 RepID=UPI00361D55DE
MPPIDKYIEYVRSIWESGQLTNNGPLVKEFELLLATEFGVKHVVLVSSGTVAIQIALKALGIEGVVLTTPFSFVATSSAIAWQGIEFDFADIDAESLCLSPDKLSEQMSPDVGAIMGTHVFGNACDIEGIEKISKKWGVPVIYDAAHTYGATYKGRSLMAYGDVSILSLHATKLFHSVEGGVLATNDESLAKKFSYMRNFGFASPEAFQGVGINGKMSEFHAAMGLSLLGNMSEVISARIELVDLYDSYFYEIEEVSRPVQSDHAISNAAYYPIILPSETAVLGVLKELECEGVFARRYFYPCLTELPYSRKSDVPIAEDISLRVLCLPLYYGLTNEEVVKIVNCVKMYFSSCLSK